MGILEKIFGRTPGVDRQWGFRHDTEEEETKVKIIAGLGNPGMKYAGTRHNIGFAVIEELAERHGIRLTDGKFRGRIGTGIIGGTKVLLVQPQTFMNNSGECIGPLCGYYRTEPEDLLVVYDDVALDTGRIRIRKSGSAGGHNGMKSILSHLGTQSFPRLRIGVGKKPAQMDLADHVLGHFSREDLTAVRKAVGEAADAVEMVLAEGIDIAMNRYNVNREPAGPAAMTQRQKAEGSEPAGPAAMTQRQKAEGSEPAGPAAHDVES